MEFYFFQVWCNSHLCDLDPNSTKQMCAQGFTCVPSSSESCFTKPCRIFGRCRPSQNFSEALSLETTSAKKCQPNNAILSNNCAKITLFFDKSHMPNVSLLFFYVYQEALSLARLINMLIFSKISFILIYIRYFLYIFNVLEIVNLLLIINVFRFNINY